VITNSLWVGTSRPAPHRVSTTDRTPSGGTTRGYRLGLDWPSDGYATWVLLAGGIGIGGIAVMLVMDILVLRVF